MVVVLLMGGCLAVLASNSGNQTQQTSNSATTPNAATVSTPRLASTPIPAATPNPAGTCSPEPCANDNYGWIVNVSNVRYNVQSGNGFEKAEAGNVYVAVDVTFTNKLKTEQNANSGSFVLQDGAGIKHTSTFFDACQIWSPVNLTTGASFGPKCVAFEAAAHKPSGLVLVWTPSGFGGGYQMNLS